jgi:hypothetical protein
MLLEANRAHPNNGNPHRPCDWAIVNTSLGQMLEPFQFPFARKGMNDSFQAFDHEDMINRVDEIRLVNFDVPASFLGNGDQTFSLDINPRLGR